MLNFLNETVHAYLNWWKQHRLDVSDLTFSNQLLIADKMETFAKAHDHCFSRDCKAGHFTASAFVLSPCGEKVLLNHHAKLKKWLHLGGHADGDHRLHLCAQREVWEESGIHEMEFMLSPERPIPFDLDIHWFPDSAKEEGHWHLDVSYPIRALKESIVISEESIDLQWIPRDQLKLYTNEESILRMNFKIELIEKILVKS